MKVLFVSLIFGLTTLAAHGDHRNSKVIIQNATGTVPVYVSQDVNSKTVQVAQSFGVQHAQQPTQVYPTWNQSEEIVSSINSKIPSTAAVFSSNQYKVPTAVSGSHYGTQPNKFVPSQFLGYNKPTVQKAAHKFGTKKLPPYTPSAQRRVDSEVSEDDSEANIYGDDDGDDYAGYGNYKQHYDEQEHDPYPEKEPYAVSETPETRENLLPGLGLGGDGGGLGFMGPAPFDPLPAPPTPITGSVDYILIPLVLIGLAGPIFVVLYVILGAFENKLAPITRSLDGFDAYKPYLDNLMSSVGRALDKNECLDYAACQLGSFSNQLGYTNSPILKTTLDSFTPTFYKRSVRKLFDAMKDTEECSISKCISLASFDR